MNKLLYILMLLVLISGCEASKKKEELNDLLEKEVIPHLTNEEKPTFTEEQWDVVQSITQDNIEAQKEVELSDELSESIVSLIEEEFGKIESQNTGE